MVWSTVALLASDHAVAQGTVVTTRRAKTSQIARCPCHDLHPGGNLPVAPYAALSSPQPSSDVTKKLHAYSSAIVMSHDDSYLCRNEASREDLSSIRCSTGPICLFFYMFCV